MGTNTEIFSSPETETLIVENPILFQSRPVTSIQLTRDFVFAAEGSAILVSKKVCGSCVGRFLLSPLAKPISGFSVCETPDTGTGLHIPMFVHAKRWNQFFYFDVINHAFQKMFVEMQNMEGLQNRNVIASRWIELGTKIATVSDENVLDIIDLKAVLCGITQGNQNGLSVKSITGVGTSLFSANIAGDIEDNLIVFSGTNLGQLYVWVPNDVSRCYHLLIEGIKGSVLSIKFCEEAQLLVASSDERSAYVWKFSDALKTTSLIANTLKVELVAEMTGHTGRVWQVDVTADSIVSVGQDSRVLLWSLDGRLLEAFSRTAVVSVRCCKYDTPSKSVIFGADDGSIHVWKIGEDSSMHILRPESIDDYPRQISFYRSSNLVFSTSLGRIMSVDTSCDSKTPFEIYSNPELQNYNVFAISPCETAIAVGSKAGHVCFINLKDFSEGSFYSINFKTKIVSLLWTKSDQLVASTCDKVYLVDKVCMEEGASVFETRNTYVIDWKDKPGVSSAISIEAEGSDYLVLSDEFGRLYVCNARPSSETLLPLYSIAKVHGTYGVCDLKYSSGGEFWSAGRSKHIKKWKLQLKPEIKLVCLQSLLSCVNWNSKLITHSSGSLLCGFAENEFIVYNLSEDLILERIPCGGAHRSWDVSFSPSSTSLSFKFAFIRNKSICLASSTRNSTSLKGGSYGGKTLNIVKTCPIIIQPDANRNFHLIMGGEDCVLRLIECEHEISHMSSREISTFKSHISSVRAINLHVLDTECRSLLVFSGGGRSQLIASKIEFSQNSSQPVLWSEKSSIILQNSGNMDAEIDMRIMSIGILAHLQDILLIICACSDGSVKSLRYNKKSSRFSMTLSWCMNSLEGSIPHAITTVAVSEADSPSLNIFSADSRGTVASMSCCGQEGGGPLEVRTWWHMRASTSSITAMDSITTNGNVYVITGSDDGILRVFAVKKNSVRDQNVGIPMVLIYENRVSHCAAINSTNVYEKQFICAGSADQIVTITNIHSWKSVTCRVGVTDVQGIELVERNGSHYLIAVGQGLEISQVNLKNVK